MTDKKFETVSLQGHTERSLIPVGQTNERYLLLELQAPAPSRQIERLPLNVSLIIDRSGSMSGHKLEYVKEAAIHALRLLTEVDRASIVIYDDEVKVLASSQAVTSEARNALIRLIRQVRTGGMTNLSGGWFTGCDQIADYMTKDYLNRALLLTDGLANVGLTDQELLVHEAKELRRRGISTTTFGVGQEFNQFLLHGIADAGGGHFYFIDKPNQIPNYFNGELGELLQTVVREMTLDIDLPNGVEANLLNDIPSEQINQRLRLFLGDAYAGEQRTLVVKLKLPGSTMGQDLHLPLTLRYEDVQQRRPMTVEGETIHFVVADGQTCDKQPVNERVLEEAGRMEAEQAKMEALRREYAGDIPGAQARLRQVKEGLAAKMPAPLAASLSAELEAMEEATALGMSDLERKQRHYATYQAQHSRKDYKQE